MTEAEMAEAVHLAGLVSALAVQHTGLEIDEVAFAAEASRAAAHITRFSND